ncbi:hypothetical protein SDC9_27782 [bioreactor metagenome]|uniref:Uncharacterized protein n=1 Tax=bioreactor metagenome TaxID=1076179 RepID=A0A644USL3_9ZZZZ
MDTFAKWLEEIFANDDKYLPKLISSLSDSEIADMLLNKTIVLSEICIYLSLTKARPIAYILEQRIKNY